MKKILAIMLSLMVLTFTGCVYENKTLEPAYANNPIEIYTDLNDNTIKLNPRTKTFELDTYGYQGNINGHYEESGDNIILHSNVDTGSYKVFSKQGSRLRYDAYKSTDTTNLIDGSSFERR